MSRQRFGPLEPATQPAQAVIAGLPAAAGGGKSLGFTLLEIALVLLIVSLLLVSGIASLSSQRENSQREKVQLYLEGMREALIGYAVRNGRLPCPDTDFDGFGNVTAGVCDALIGTLPWGDFLNVDKSGSRVGRPLTAGLDPWGNPFTYDIGRAYNTTIAWTDAVCADCLLTVEDAAATLLANDAAAVIVSHGKNGRGHYLSNTVPLTRTNMPAVADSEYENANDDKLYRQGAGDDALIWFAPAEVKLPLQRAGRIAP
ncbi:MAG: hypothetical protein HQL80_00505 [Magnetococcales bacterium]|nr:hypothetical protein [Magnetococcales bacterium]